MNLKITEDEILTLYNYFDRKKLGEISLKRWLQNFEVIEFLGLGRVNDPNVQKDLGELVSQRQKVIEVIQRVYMFCQDKGYNKR